MTIEWPEEAGSKIEGKTRLNLDEAEDEFQRRERERREAAEKAAANGSPES